MQQGKKINALRILLLGQCLGMPTIVENRKNILDPHCKQKEQELLSAKIVKPSAKLYKAFECVKRIRRMNKNKLKITTVVNFEEPELCP